ncbi:hypothetical protein O3P69_014496 [Scylla paramamosain]|uniref:Ionotropic glutamate receptor L-glutamate and glycine-binding domain-containing protein n=1 Tax=Scylla paramamosain TaxID=85552 RepID=A0AAW0TBE5_SCYPA
MKKLALQLVLLRLLLLTGILRADLMSLLPGTTKPVAVQAVASVLAAHSPCAHTTLLLTDGTQTKRLLQEVEAVHAPRGVTVFHMEGNHQGSNTTEVYLRMTVDKLRQLGGAWHCLVVVVVSDDPAFLAAFAHLSLRRHAFRWSTRILVFTRLPLSHLGGLHGLLSNRNAMLLHVQEGEEADRCSEVDVFVWQPYSAPTSTPLRVATWTPHVRLTHTSFFPDKFYVFSSPPTLTVAVEFLPHHTLTWVKDSDTPDGSRLELTGFLNEFVTYFAKAMNFRYRYVVSRERTFGTKLPDGSWTGMMGMLVREEADFSPGPFVLSSVRAEAAQATTEYTQGGLRILSGLTGLKIDPWGFLLPLTPLVWAITLTALLGVLFVRQLLPSCLPGRSLLRCGWSANTFSPVRVLLQQGEASRTDGPLLPGSALRLEGFRALREQQSCPNNSASLTPNADVDVKDGVFREVAELEDVGRLKFHIQTKIPESIDTLVRAAHHVLVETDVLLRNHVALDFSREGECCLVPRGDAPRLVGCCYSVTVLPA